jgi:two-component system, cell cycle sensor histidine kinase and response regulator CckA
MAERGGNEVAGMASASGRISVVLSLSLAALLAVAVGVGVWQLQDAISRGLLITGAVFALAGLFALFGFMGGLIRFDRQNQTRAFFDGLTDAIGDACVVTDGKSRAVYGNAPFLQLASKAGVNRLVGFDLLYAGQAAFVEPIYQLAQAALEGKTDSREIRLPAGSTAAGASPDMPKWLKISVAPLSGQAKPNFVLWRLQDVSVDRARQEKAFGRLQFIITYLDHAPAGFFSSLPNQKIDYLNATLAEWLGLDIAESQNGGLHLSDVLGETGARLLTAIEPLASVALR